MFNSNTGARNLILLGLVSTIIAIATTAVSLVIYHYSGDIYLDRSRPGFLPDEKEEEEREEQVNAKYSFSDTGELNVDAYNEYLEKIKSVQSALDQLKNPFSEDSLSDESLGFPQKKEQAQPTMDN